MIIAPARSFARGAAYVPLAQGDDGLDLDLCAFRQGLDFIAGARGVPADVVMTDTAYDSDRLRNAIADKGAVAVIPNNPSRAQKYPLDKHLYAQRHLIECCFSRLKQFRRVATRFEKAAENYLAVVTIAAIVLWIR